MAAVAHWVGLRTLVMAGGTCVCSFISEGSCRTRYPGDGEDNLGCEPWSIVSRLLQDDPSVSSSLKKKLYLFLAVLIIHCFAQAFSSCGERGPLFLVVCGLLIAEHRLWGMWASVAAAPRL